MLSLPDSLEVLPAHFAGSACGAGMSGKPSSTLAFEKRWNPAPTWRASSVGVYRLWRDLGYASAGPPPDVDARRGDR